MLSKNHHWRHSLAIFLTDPRVQDSPELFDSPEASYTRRDGYPQPLYKWDHTNGWLDVGSKKSPHFIPISSSYPHDIPINGWFISSIMLVWAAPLLFATATVSHRSLEFSDGNLGRIPWGRKDRGTAFMLGSWGLRGCTTIDQLINDLITDLVNDSQASHDSHEVTEPRKWQHILSPCQIPSLQPFEYTE